MAVIPEKPAALPSLGQILETALYVADLERAGRFYQEILRLRPLAADGRFHAYAAGERNVLLLFEHGSTTRTVQMKGGTIPPHGQADAAGAQLSQHIAFSVEDEAGLRAWEAQLGAAGVAIDGRTAWPNGGHSIYFRDPDGHLLELATPGLWDIPGG